MLILYTYICFSLRHLWTGVSGVPGLGVSVHCPSSSINVSLKLHYEYSFNYRLKRNCWSIDIRACANEIVKENITKIWQIINIMNKYIY